jgi:hypothetical protein
MAPVLTTACATSSLLICNRGLVRGVVSVRRLDVYKLLTRVHSWSTILPSSVIPDGMWVPHRGRMPQHPVQGLAPSMAPVHALDKDTDPAWGQHLQNTIFTTCSLLSCLLSSPAAVLLRGLC